MTDETTQSAAQQGAPQETHAFQAEVSEVLSLVIHSLYSNPEIFLRELISNASDALDRQRVRALTEEGVTAVSGPSIRVLADTTAGTLTISDNGTGMDREALIKNLGTVAHSGSKAFLAALEDKSKGADLIGQFGVGFYSGFLVADRAEVVSCPVGGREALRWSSDGKSGFTIGAASRVEPGTDVILHLKEDKKEFLERARLRTLIEKYSDFIRYPIELAVRAKEDTKLDWEKVNQASALWQRSPSEVTDEQYQEFYQHLTHDWEKPLSHQHFRIEGTKMFSGVIFIPARPPFDLYSPESRHGVRLFVKRVFIMDDCEELLPKWLRFARGVVDSDDLPLNVSREILQDSSIVQVIRKQIVKQCLKMIEGLAKGDDYVTFWSQFGSVLKEGLHFEPEHSERLAALCRWESTTRDGLVSLDQYVESMKEGQKSIYYALGATRDAVAHAPHLESLRAKGIEVLLMTDAVDQWAVDGLKQYKDTPLVSAMDADLKLDGEDAEKKTDHGDLDGLVNQLRVWLQEDVSEVRISDRLTDSPVCLVTPEGGLPPYMERLLRMQNQELPKQKRVLEINPTHRIVVALKDRIEKEPKDTSLESTAKVLYQQALLAEGSPLERPDQFVKEVTRLLGESLHS